MYNDLKWQGARQVETMMSKRSKRDVKCLPSGAAVIAGTRRDKKRRSGSSSRVKAIREHGEMGEKVWGGSKYAPST